MALSQERGKLAVLTRDVESARGAYDSSLQRHTQVRLESRLDQTDIAVLNAAIPPLVPTFPKIPLNIVLSVFIGLMLGVGMALLMEMMNRRVRSRDDLTYAAGGAGAGGDCAHQHAEGQAGGRESGCHRPRRPRRRRKRRR